MYVIMYSVKYYISNKFHNNLIGIKLWVFLVYLFIMALLLPLSSSSSSSSSAFHYREYMPKSCFILANASHCIYSTWDVIPIPIYVDKHTIGCCSAIWFWCAPAGKGRREWDSIVLPYEDAVYQLVIGSNPEISSLYPTCKCIMWQIFVIRDNLIHDTYHILALI